MGPKDFEVVERFDRLGPVGFGLGVEDVFLGILDALIECRCVNFGQRADIFGQDGQLLPGSTSAKPPSTK